MNIGIEFETQVQKYFNNTFKGKFKKIVKNENKITIGLPPKPHCFDFISEEENVIVECKGYNWRKKVQVPCAKISTLNEAVLFFQHINSPYDKYLKVIVMKKTNNIDDKGTLAQYYVNTYGSLLGDIEVVEMDDNNKITVIKGEQFNKLLNKYLRPNLH